MALPFVLKAVIFLALSFSGLLNFLFFIGGGAGGSKSMAFYGFLVGGASLIACGYSFFALTRPSQAWWELVLIALACWPFIGLLLKLAQRVVS